MYEEFCKYFQEAQIHKNNQLISIPVPIELKNPHSQSIYFLTHRYSTSPNTFLAHDLSKKGLMLKILPCSSHSELKSAHQTLKKTYEAFPENSLVPLFDEFEIFDELWHLIIVSVLLSGISIYDFSDYLSENVYFLPKDLSIAILLVLLDILQHQKHPGSFECLYPNSVLICKSSGGVPFAKISNIYYNIVILPFSQRSLLGRPSRSEFLYKPANQLWGLGICIYGLIGSFPYKSLPKLQGITNDQLDTIIPLRDSDPALERVFCLLTRQQDPSVLSHPYLKLWGGIYQKNWGTIDLCGVEEKEVLHSGLFFTDTISRKLVIKKLLVLGKAYIEIYEYLMSHEIFMVFIEMCIRIDWNECPELLEPFYKFLKYKPKDHLFKQKLGEMGILGMAIVTISLDPHNVGFYKFVQDYMQQNTLTIMQILYDKGVVARSIKLAKASHYDKEFLGATMSLYGPYCVKVIEQVFLLEVFPYVKLIQAMMEVPYQHKLESMDSMLKLLAQILRKTSKEDIDVTNFAIELTFEMISIPFFIQNAHMARQCTSHSSEESLAMSKNSFLICCSDCNVIVCTNCYRNLHFSHAGYYLLYMTPHFRCNCMEFHELQIFNQMTFSLANSDRFTFSLSNGSFLTESSVNVFSSEKDLIISTREPFLCEISEDDSKVAAYFEIKVLKAGKFENIVIGFLGVELYYHGMNGVIALKNTEAARGPRFGSYDTVGIGILTSSKAFITYNGLLVNNFIPCEPLHEVKLFLAMFGEDCEVEIKLRRFLFLSAKPQLDNFNGDSRKSLEDVLKLLANRVKKGTDIRLPDIRTKFKDMLIEWKKLDLAKKL